MFELLVAKANERLERYLIAEQVVLADAQHFRRNKPLDEREYVRLYERP